MYARLVAMVSKSDYCLGALVEAYKEDYRVADVINLISRKYREMFVDPKEEIVEGEVVDADAIHVLSWEDGANETMRIYEIIA